MFDRTTVLQEEPVSARRTMSWMFTVTFTHVHLCTWLHGQKLWNK